MNEKTAQLDTKPKIDRTVQDRIGRELRAMYQELLRQPLPENLLAPLRTNDAAETARGKLEEAVQGMRRPVLDASAPAATPVVPSAPQAPVSAPQAKLA